MSFATDETSVAQARPVELYEFVAGTSIYRYTSYSSSVMYLGQTYTAIPISRTNPTISAASDQPEISVTIHETASIAGDAAFFMPPQGLALTIRRLQQVSNESIVIWLGKITSFRASGRELEILSPSILDAALSSQVPSAYLQRLCNHVLYDESCAVTRALFQHVTTVVSQVGRILTVGSVPATGTLKSGEAVLGNGERRTIIAQSTTTLTMLTAFRAVSGGQAITLFQGCDHTVQTCKTTFNNVPRFGGFPYLDWKNPFENGHLWSS